MAGTVSSWQQSSFANPQNGQAGDASVVLGNDNAIRGKHNSHDADPTIHIQSSDLATRPAAGTPQRAWWTTDAFRLYFDFGGVWNELKVRAEDVLAGSLGAGNFVITGDLSISDDLTVTDDASIGGDLSVTGTLTAGAFSFSSVTASGTVQGADLVATDDLTVDDDAAIGGDLAVTGAVSVTGILSVARINSLSGAWSVWTTDALPAPTTVESIRVQAGSVLGQTALYIRRDDNGNLVNVEFGAADSGGAGYRMLRITN